jgi:branched-subunit amino acid aminotransferase/4-amino-4-deoxychorismate lyase
MPAMEAAKKGYSQILWLYGADKQVTEVGTMNQFFFWKNAETGRPELVTAPLDGLNSFFLGAVFQHHLFVSSLFFLFRYHSSWRYP